MVPQISHFHNCVIPKKHWIYLEKKNVKTKFLMQKPASSILINSGFI